MQAARSVNEAGMSQGLEFLRLPLWLSRTCLDILSRPKDSPNSHKQTSWFTSEFDRGLRDIAYRLRPCRLPRYLNVRAKPRGLLTTPSMNTADRCSGGL